jgi:hypothetical protein
MGFMTAWGVHRSTRARVVSAGVLLGAVTVVPALPALADSPQVVADASATVPVDDPTAPPTAQHVAPRVPQTHPTTKPTVPQIGALSLSGSLSLSGGSDPVRAGTGLLAAWTVRNTGSAVVTGVTVRGPAGDASCVQTSLQPGAVTTCRSSQMILTQQLVDAGSVSVAGLGRGMSGGTILSSSPVQLTTLVPAAPTLALVQSHQLRQDVNHDGRPGAKDRLAFSYTVANTGNVTLKSPGITSSLLLAHGLRATCRLASLPPRVATTCLAQGLVVSSAEAARHQLLSDARATGVSPHGLRVSSPASLVAVSLAWSQAPAASPGKPAVGTPAKSSARSVSVPKPKPAPKPPQPQLKPGLAIAMTVASVVDNFEHNGVSDVGDGIVYHYVVANVGQLSLSGITLSDVLERKTGGVIRCPATSLRPGAVMTCDATRPYIVTRTEFHAGELRNRVTARALVDRSGRSIGAAASLSRPLAVPLAQTVGPVIVGSALPFTGAAPAPLVYTGVLLLLSGLGLMLLRRRLDAA